MYCLLGFDEYVSYMHCLPSVSVRATTTITLLTAFGPPRILWGTRQSTGQVCVHHYFFAAEAWRGAPFSSDFRGGPRALSAHPSPQQSLQRRTMLGFMVDVALFAADQAVGADKQKTQNSHRVDY